MINKQQFSANLTYLRKAHATSLTKIAECVVFGIAQATQTATDENPSLRPNFEFLTRLRKVVADVAPRKCKVGDFDAYLVTVVLGEVVRGDETLTGPLLSVSNQGKIGERRGANMATFNSASLEDGSIHGRFWEVSSEEEKEQITDAEKFERAVARAVKAGLSPDELVNILCRIAEIDLDTAEEPLDPDEVEAALSAVN